MTLWSSGERTVFSINGNVRTGYPYRKTNWSWPLPYSTQKKKKKKIPDGIEI